MKLPGRTVLITGASQGLGAATAQAMAARGADVVLLARSEDKLREVASSIERSGGHADVHPVDLADLEAVFATTDAIKAQGMIPDVIVNNAGIGALALHGGDIARGDAGDHGRPLLRGVRGHEGVHRRDGRARQRRHLQRQL